MHRPGRRALSRQRQRPALRLGPPLPRPAAGRHAAHRRRRHADHRRWQLPDGLRRARRRRLRGGLSLGLPHAAPSQRPRRGPSHPHPGRRLGRRLRRPARAVGHRAGRPHPQPDRFQPRRDRLPGDHRPLRLRRVPRRPALACERDTYPYGDWAADGLYAEDAANVTLRHLDIHGLASAGVHAGRLTDWTVEDVRIAGNGWVGWEGDIDGDDCELRHAALPALDGGVERLRRDLSRRRADRLLGRERRRLRRRRRHRRDRRRLDHRGLRLSAQHLRRPGPALPQRGRARRARTASAPRATPATRSRSPARRPHQQPAGGQLRLLRRPALHLPRRRLPGAGQHPGACLHRRRGSVARQLDPLRPGRWPGGRRPARAGAVQRLGDAHRLEQCLSGRHRLFRPRRRDVPFLPGGLRRPQARFRLQHCPQRQEHRLRRQRRLRELGRPRPVPGPAAGRPAVGRGLRPEADRRQPGHRRRHTRPARRPSTWRACPATPCPTWAPTSGGR